MTKIAYGINLNPQDPSSRPADASELQGLQWVRLVFQCAAAEYPDLTTAFDFYDDFIQRYNAAGVRCLLILNQETFWGHGPWHHGDWPAYAEGFAEQAGQIAAHYRGKNVAYQIWNEGDTHGASSIHVAPNEFAPVLEKATAAIKAADPDAAVVLGGLASGTETAIRYVKDLREALGGELPMDAIAVHPYGHWPPSGQPTIPTGWFAPLEPALGRYCDEFAGKPIWVTEIGISEPGGIAPDHWPKVADFMAETCTLIQERYTSAIPVLIWFAWSDAMRGAGIVDRDGHPKQPIYEKFFEMARTLPAELPAAVIPPPTALTPTDSLRVRAGPGLDHDVIDGVSPGDRLSVEEAWETAWAKLGRNGNWINIRTPRDLVGWSAAWYLKLALDIPDEAPAILTPSGAGLRVREGPGLAFSVLGHVNPGDLLSVLENWPGAVAKLGHRGKWINVRLPDGVAGWTAAWILRLPTPEELDRDTEPHPSHPTGYSEAELLLALEFDREPSFERLPVCDPTQISSFSGFGPNNFSYLTYASGKDYYRNLNGLHNGLDFGMPIGTALCALDWGVVVHASRRDNDNPYSAGPFSVIIRHGRYVALYGHAMGKEYGEHIFVQEGDIVAPGETICRSGIGNYYEHLHFEVRKIRQAYINQLRKDAELASTEPLKQLEHMQANFHLRGWWPTTDYYVNPARFFSPKLESYWATYAWPHACMVQQDGNRNGFPDRVVRSGQQQPQDYGLYSLSAFGPGEPHFWRGSRVV
jgi:murein DD-endopeptidase MepM/ murein hydrolase activator NlpD